jgi:hypothetical protein
MVKHAIIQVDILPQELWITLLSFLQLKDIHSCSLSNKQWNDFIHANTSTSLPIWRTLYHQLDSKQVTLPSNDNLTWKQLYRQAVDLQFITDGVDGIDFYNFNRSLSSHSDRWKTVLLNKTIDVNDYIESGKFCFEIVLDEFNPKTATSTNYYSVVVGVHLQEDESSLKASEILGYNNDNEIGYFCGTRIVWRRNSINYTGTSGIHGFPEDQYMIKSGDIIRAEITIHKPTFDIDFYVNGELQERQDPNGQNYLQNIEAQYITPGVSVVFSHKLSVRRVFPLSK